VSEFAKIFSEPVSFTDDCWVLSREQYPDREAAAALFADYLEKPVDPARLEEDRIRFRFPGEEDHPDFTPGRPAWFAGACGRGSRPVWLLED
jgi:hypothetical protein